MDELYFPIDPISARVTDIIRLCETMDITVSDVSEAALQTAMALVLRELEALVPKAASKANIVVIPGGK